MFAFSVDRNLATSVPKGSARVLTTTSFRTSERILCSAFLTDLANDPPSVMLNLDLIRRNEQKGQ